MNAVIPIQDQGKPRDAIPVRALPWLTSHHFCAQEVADALAHEVDDFISIHAYRLDGNVVRIVASGEWDDVAVEIERIHQFENSIYEQRAAETKAIPADVFVWLDEWTEAYNESAYGPNNLERLGDIADMKDVRKRTLNLAPYVPANLVQLVKEGFPDDAPEQSAAGDVQQGRARDEHSAPQTDSTAVRHVSKGRQKGAIANIIDEIIRSNVGYSNAQIWEVLKTSALNENAPFTGGVAGASDPAVIPGSLAYTNVKNVIGWYTRKHLTDHLAKPIVANSRQ